MQDFVKAYLPEKGEKMLKQLGSRLKEFGQTPLLLWMLCLVFESNESQIPANLGLVFRSFTEGFDWRKREREGVKIPDKLRRWQKRLLQHLAWVMTTGEKPTEIKLSISKSKAEDILREFLQGKVPYSDDTALEWLEDLLKYYLIQVTPDNRSIEFCHQLIQEYYTAEALL
jgi:predicted NACHT family NTPase